MLPHKLAPLGAASLGGLGAFVDGLKPESWDRIKSGLLELIYTEFGLEYPVFSQAEKV